MTPLASQQQALLQALWAPGADEALRGITAHVVSDARLLRGLRAYRSHGRALAQRALAAAYPRVLAALGEEDFGGLAQAHWLAQPPSAGDIARWGGALADHIESIPALVADHPGLAHLARIEWELHRAAFAADAQPELASLELLVHEDPACLVLELSPGARCIAGVVIWREGLRPCKRAALPGEADFIAALQEGRPLLDSLSAAPALDFNAWLAAAVPRGLVLRARLQTPQGETT